MVWPLDYPGPIPEDSYLFLGATVEPLTGVPPVGGRAALLACGSNASPEQLHRKFAGTDVDPTMPVLRATVGRLASVYSRHVTRYGAIPATPMAVPDGESDVFVLLVDGAQLARIDTTEGDRYERRQLDPGRHPVTLRSGRVVAEVGCYVSRFGALGLDGAPIGLAAFPMAAGAGASMTTMSEREVWTAVAARWSQHDSAFPSDAGAAVDAAVAAVAEDGPQPGGFVAATSAIDLGAFAA